MGIFKLIYLVSLIGNNPIFHNYDNLKCAFSDNVPDINLEGKISVDNFKTEHTQYYLTYNYYEILSKLPKLNRYDSLDLIGIMNVNILGKVVIINDISSVLLKVSIRTYPNLEDQYLILLNFNKDELRSSIILAESIEGPIYEERIYAVIEGFKISLYISTSEKIKEKRSRFRLNSNGMISVR